ncbi:tetratricopeptide repeat protein [Nonomuraea sp. NPDC049714]|uniref:tetratricopeptide repeat protein n=1 Tax=Nonomuraea sp. NPDC049714 TaxID=3364357 RepID=UPI0037B4E149
MNGTLACGWALKISWQCRQPGGGWELGDRRGEGQALNNLGNALQEVRRFEEAITAHQDAAAIFREVGDAHRLGN